MKRLTASILAMGLAATVGTASAQSSGYYPNSDGYGQYGQPSVDRYGQNYGAKYDYARVVRVDPVFDSGYRSSNDRNNSAQNCYTRRDGYAGNDAYGNDSYYTGNNGYNSNGYNSNGYNNNGYN
ncbi:MAG: hypothetical protein ABJA62_09355, partial [Luteimonas sp.]